VSPAFISVTRPTKSRCVRRKISARVWASASTLSGSRRHWLRCQPRDPLPGADEESAPNSFYLWRLVAAITTSKIDEPLPIVIQFVARVGGVRLVVQYPLEHTVRPEHMADGGTAHIPIMLYPFHHLQLGSPPQFGHSPARSTSLYPKHPGTSRLLEHLLSNRLEPRGCRCQG
jgi:hypothetical protein